MGNLFDIMEEEFLKKNEMCNYFDLEEVEQSLESARYDTSNACRATHQLIRNTINWAAKFCVPCNGKRPRVFEEIQNSWIGVSKSIRSRFPSALCEREPEIEPLNPYAN